MKLYLQSIIITIIILSLSNAFAQVEIKSPGNVSNATAWFKADNYTNGSLSWTNSVSNAGMQNLTTDHAPTFEAANPLWNYNSSVSFGGKSADQGFRATVNNVSDILNPDQGVIIAVASYSGNSSDRGVCGYRSNNTYKNELSILYNETWFRGHLYSSGVSLNWTSPIGNTPSIRTMRFHRTNNGAYKKVSLNSFNNSVSDREDINSTVTSGAGYLRETGTKMFAIGEIPNAHFYKGSIAEVVVFSDAISNSERLRTESYLAIKYGITLGTPTKPVNYTSSNVQNLQNIWIGDPVYQNNIIGIGRDDLSELKQKQSHQRDDLVRIYLGDLKNTNKENQKLFTKDRSYVVMGSNEKELYATDASNATMYAGIANSTCALFSVIERKWKIQRTNMPDKFNIDIKLDDYAKLNLIDKNDLRLLVDNNNDFGDGWEGCFANGDAGLDIFYDNINGIITFKGINVDHIPDNAIRYISIGSVDRGTPLPVGLTNFMAQCHRTNVELVWQTESEANNDYFTIEKSTDGVTFEELNITEGSGNLNTARIYSYTDYTNQVGINYYRLSQTDFDGKVTILKTISSNCDGDLEIVIYPNPTRNGVYVTLNGKSKLDVDVIVYSMSGQQVSQHIIKGSTWIQLPEEDGIYLIKYVLNGKEHVEKIVKH